MGKYKNGILYGFSGKVGPVIGSSWKGIEYMKSRSSKSSKAPTPNQLVARAKFLLMIRFVSSMGKLLMESFKDGAINMTGTNSAFGYNYKNAINGTYPVLSINYKNVLVSRGGLHNALHPTASAAGNGEVKMEWGDNSNTAMANASDRCFIVVYCGELGRSVFSSGNAERSTTTDSINAGIFKGKLVQTWVGFISADGLEIATSIYTGQLLVV